jgi:hypothetical protein
VCLACNWRPACGRSRPEEWSSQMRMAAAAAIIPEPEPGAEGPEQRRASAAPWPCT